MVQKQKHINLIDFFEIIIHYSQSILFYRTFLPTTFTNNKQQHSSNGPLEHRHRLQYLGSPIPARQHRNNLRLHHRLHLSQHFIKFRQRIHLHLLALQLLLVASMIKLLVYSFFFAFEPFLNF